MCVVLVHELLLSRTTLTEPFIDSDATGKEEHGVTCGDNWVKGDDPGEERRTNEKTIRQIKGPNGGGTTIPPCAPSVLFPGIVDLFTWSLSM